MNPKNQTASELHQNVPPDWYDRSIKENLFQRYWHHRRFDEVSKLIEPVKGKILDIGSADGTFTKVILKHSHASQIIGIDVLRSSVDWANRHRQSAKLKFMVADGHKLKFPPRTFDAVFTLEVLEHVFQPQKVLQEVKRVLKPGGYAVFLVPSENQLFKFVWFLWKFYRGKIWKDTHVQDFNHDFLVNLCQQVGFQIEINHKFLLGMLQAIKVRKL